MPRGGAVSLKDLDEDHCGGHLTIACQSCGRWGCYLVSRLMVQHRDMVPAEVLALVTKDCPNYSTAAIHDGYNAMLMFWGKEKEKGSSYLIPRWLRLFISSH